MRLDHVALTVADRERSAAFYAAHLGFVARQVFDPDSYRVELFAYADG